MSSSSQDHQLILEKCLEILSESQTFHSAQQLAKAINSSNNASSSSTKRKAIDNIKNNTSSGNKDSSNKIATTIVVTPQDIRTILLSNIRHYRLGSSFREFWNRFGSSKYEIQTLKNTLITHPFQFLGMSLITSPVLMWYIPRECEGNFFEIKPSTIPKAGNGLFVRRFASSSSSSSSSAKNYSLHSFTANIVIPRGTIIGEYHGYKIADQSDFKGNQIDYAVKLKNNEFVVGVDEHRNLTCFCASANDNGMKKRNVAMKEFSSKGNTGGGGGSSSCSEKNLTGRPFFVTTRDICSGEEIFVTYGADFWGAESYDDIAVTKIPTTSSVAPPDSGQQSGEKQSGKRRNREEESEQEDASSATTPVVVVSSSSKTTSKAISRLGWEDKLSECFRCRDCRQFIPNYLKLIHPDVDCPSKNAALIKNANEMFVSWLKEHTNVFGSSAHHQHQHHNKNNNNSNTTDNNSNNKRVVTVKCLPKNEFTSVVFDSAQSDGLVSHHQNNNNNGNNNNSNKIDQERQDWCLKRAMAFYGWNTVFSHESLEDGTEPKKQKQKQTTSSSKSSKSSEDEKKPSSKAVSKRSDNNNNHHYNEQEADDDDLTSSTIRRSTTLPILRESLSFYHDDE